MSPSPQGPVDAPPGTITDVAGIWIGHHTRTEDGARTGVTVVIAPNGAVAAVDVRGGGPGTRETDALGLTTLVERIHAICLSGGSAFGLGAAHGVMEWCRQRGWGVDLGRGPTEVVPVVPAAVIFDLGRGGDFTAWPTAADGHRAADTAGPHGPCRGTLGAGTGALTGGLQGGLGSASHVIDEGAFAGCTVGALVVLNSSGSAVNPHTGRPWDTSGRPMEPATAAQIAALDAARRAPRGPHITADHEPLNTIVGVIATDANLTPAETQRCAMVGHDGYARAVRPVHSLFDGDTVFALATGAADAAAIDASTNDSPANVTFGAQDSRAAAVNAVLAAAADVMAAACTDALLAASTQRPGNSGVPNPPSYNDLAPGHFRGA